MNYPELLKYTQKRKPVCPTESLSLNQSAGGRKREKISNERNTDLSLSHLCYHFDKSFRKLVETV